MSGPHLNFMEQVNVQLGKAKKVEDKTAKF